MKEKEDVIIKKLFGDIRCTTFSMYYKQIKHLISILELEEKHDEHILFCKINTEYWVKEVSKHYGIEYRITYLLPDDVICIYAERNIFNNERRRNTNSNFKMELKK